VPNIRWLLALITAVHRFVYRATGGRLGANLAGTRILLLTTVGRKTGRERVTPLLFVRDGECFVVVASNAGDDRNPAWWLNLRARPEAEIQVGPEHHRVRARRASPDEAARLWPLLEASYRHYAEYRGRTSRAIPVVMLERAVTADAAA
jgi:deazaflavin-dependent oxidoreductase (nitroreductase family)